MHSVVTNLIEYTNIRWNPDWCKRCLICVEICPRHALALQDDAIVEAGKCDRTGMCQRFCPDLAIEIIPSPSGEVKQ